MATKRTPGVAHGPGQHAAALPADADAGRCRCDRWRPGRPGAASTPEGIRYGAATRGARRCGRDLQKTRGVLPMCWRSLHVRCQRSFLDDEFSGSSCRLMLTVPRRRPRASRFSLGTSGGVPPPHETMIRRRSSIGAEHLGHAAADVVRACLGQARRAAECCPAAPPTARPPPASPPCCAD